MGPELLTEETPTLEKTNTEVFEECFPYYLAIGMSSAEYWEGDPSLARYYRKAHHRFDTKQKQIDEIFELFTNKQALIEKLAEMYAEPMETLMDDDNIDEGNAIAWEANF